MKHGRIYCLLVLAVLCWTPFASSQTQTEPPPPDTPASQPEPPKRVRVSQGVMQGLLVKRVQPSYPEEAKQARIQGPVVMQAVIGTNGDVISLRLISGHPLLAPTAMSAIRQWKYRPYNLNGTPIEVETVITFDFTLSHR